MSKYILQVLSIILTISLFIFNIYIVKSINYGFTLIVLAIMLLVSLLLFSYRRIDKRDFIYKEILIVGTTLLLQSIFYLVASSEGYITNFSSIFKNFVSKKNILMVFLIVILREVIRYIIVNVKTRKKYQRAIINILLVIFCVLIDISIATKIYSFATFSLIYDFLAMLIIPSISKNILLNYLSYKAGYIITFSYVLIMDLYIYFLPVIPNLNMLLEAVVLLVFPYFLFTFYNSFTERRRNKLPKKERKKGNKILTIISTIIFAILVCLVSREFKYSMIGVGSGSMTGTINKGDAIIYRKYEGHENLKDKVIVFKKNSVLIVHRVIKSYVMDDGMVYQTKGDYNEKADNWVITDEDIVGVVEKRIPLIAWPSVILNEIF